MIMIDADDVCKYADMLRADIIAKIIGRLGLEKTMFEASNPKTSEWFVRRYGPSVCTAFHVKHDFINPTCFYSTKTPTLLYVHSLQVNLFIDHSQVMNLECLRGPSLGRIRTSALKSSYFLM